MNQNYDFRTLHEGFLKDIFDIVCDVKNGSDSIFDKLKKHIPNVTNKGDEIKKINTGYGRNIAKAAQGLTATFPMIVTEAVPIDQAVMVAKAVERKCCAMLQMLFAANQITNVGNAHAYMAKFHKNLSDNDLDFSDYSVDDMINAAYDGINEGTIFDTIEYKALLNECIKEVNEDCKRNTHYYLSEGVTNPPVGSYMVKKVFNELDMSAFKTYTRDNSEQIRDTRVNPDEPEQIPSDVVTINRSSVTSGSKVSDLKAAYDALNKSVIPTDIQKANEATPSLLIINFITSEDPNQAIATACVIGVKVVLHYVSSADMANKVVAKNTDKRGLLNFIRATTREISFFRDFLFSVDKAKIDALSKVGKGSTSSIWKMLELRAHNRDYSKAAGKYGGSNGRENAVACAAIATIVLTKDEVDLIKKQYRIDLTKEGTLLAIMRGYSFMAAAIIDEVTEKVDFLWDDGNKRFETLSFMSLEREEANGTYKKVINMLSKGR